MQPRERRMGYMGQEVGFNLKSGGQGRFLLKTFEQKVEGRGRSWPHVCPGEEHFWAQEQECKGSEAGVCLGVKDQWGSYSWSGVSKVGSRRRSQRSKEARGGCKPDHAWLCVQSIVRMFTFYIRWSHIEQIDAYFQADFSKFLLSTCVPLTSTVGSPESCLEMQNPRSCPGPTDQRFLQWLMCTLTFEKLWCKSLLLL